MRQPGIAADNEAWGQFLSRGSGISSLQLPDNLMRVEAKHTSDLQEFDHVQSPLPALIIGNEALPPPEFRRNLDLSQSGLQARLQQQLAKAIISVTER